MSAIAVVVALALGGPLSGGNAPDGRSTLQRAQQTAIVVPHHDVMLTVSEAQAEQKAQGITAFSSQPQLTYHGGNAGIGVTTGTPKVYLVFWGSQWGSSSTGGDGDTHLSGDASNIAPRLQDFFKGVGINNEVWSGVTTQYCEGGATGATSCANGTTHVGYPTGGALAGVWVDTSGAAPSSATGNQLGTEAVAAAAHFGNTTSGSNRSVQYVVVSPSGTHPDGFNAGAGFCAWHSYVSSIYGPFAFTNLPYIPDMGWQCGAGFVNAGGSGALDGVTIVEGHEYAETITDQTLGAWWDSNGQENADKCAWLRGGGTGGLQNYTFSTGTFAVQGSWSNDTGDCRVVHAINGVAPSDFSLTASAPSSTRQGATTTSTIHTAVTHGSALPVTLSATDLPSGVTASFDTSPVTSGDSTTLSLAVGSTVVPGRYTIHVTGTANNGLTTLTHTVAVTLTTTIGNDFTMTAASVSGRQGASPVVSIATGTAFGSAQPITLSFGDLPSGVTASFGTNPVTSENASQLTFGIGANVAPGRYPVRVTGTGSSGGITLTHTAVVSLTVTIGNDFGLTGGAATATQGSSAPVSIATHTLFGSARTVTLSTGALPAGVTASFGTNPVTSDNPSALTFTVGANVVPGRYPVRVTGTSSSGDTTLTHTVVVTLTVTIGNDFSLTGGSASAQQGTSPAVSIATATTLGSAQAITLSLGALPAGVTASFGTNPVTTGDASLLTFTIAGNTTPGRYAITVTGTGSSGSVLVRHSVSVSLTVTVARALPRVVRF